mgnify:CR=1 FL=1
MYKRAGVGKLSLIATTHRDNPRFWDRAAGDYTDAGRRYVVDRLGALTGARRKRFLEGIWAAAEGLVYDGYDPGTHLLPHGWTPPGSPLVFSRCLAGLLVLSAAPAKRGGPDRHFC